MTPESQFPRRTVFSIVAVLIIIGIFGGVWWYQAQNAPVFNLLPQEKVASWTFSGHYKDGGALEAKAIANIERLKGMLGTKEYTDYQLYVSIAGEYELLGDGEQTFAYLNKALAIDADTTGLAWHNMGFLLEKLGAYESARIAYENAARVQPQIVPYQLSYIEFLTTQFKEDAAAIEGAFTDAEKALGVNVSLYQIRAKWFTELGKTTEAIEVWKKVRALVPVESRPAVDAQIASLKANA